MRRNSKKEINVFSTSAIDLFASSLGVFIVLVIIVFPYYKKTSKATPMVTEEKIQEEKKPIIQEQVKIKEQLEKVKQEKEHVEKEMEELKNQLTKANEKVREKQKRDVQSVKDQQEKTQKIQKVQQKLEQTTIEREKINQQLRLVRAQLQKKNREMEKIKRQDPRQEAKIIELQRKLTLENSKQKEIQRQLIESQEVANAVSKQLEKVEQDLEAARQKFKLEGAQEKQAGSFVAVIIKWATSKHDIDLVIKDPKNRSFDFKRKSYKHYPGLFSLDSRTGPGAELWQSSQAVPGRYTVIYKFYNHYGNTVPAVVNGSILTKQGNYSLPTAKMEFNKKREVAFTFDVSKEGNVTVNR